MASKALTGINLRSTPQRERANEREVANNEGGYVYPVEGIDRIRRFLVLGTDGGTYYQSEKQITKENAAIVLSWATHRTKELVDEVVTLSVAGRAPKQDPILFALAAAASLGDDEGRKYALQKLSLVARTGTHLFLFVTYAEQMRGWGRGLRKAVARWYTEKRIDNAAYQAIKYRQREGWSHRDLLRLSHPVASNGAEVPLFDWICGRKNEDAPQLTKAFEEMQAATTIPEWLGLLAHNPGLSWEMLPDAALNEPVVWEALLHNGVPQTALMRQLPRLTRLGLLKPMSDTLQLVTEQLTNQERITNARLHPVNILVALRTYASGHSARGQSSWAPQADVIDALDSAFYLAYGNVVPANKRTLIGVDISGSMTWPASNMPITAAEVAAALALVTAATEPKTAIHGFSTTFVNLPISPKMRLNDALRVTSNLAHGGTDCALPMVWALQQGIEVDTFEVITDNETWAGRIHPDQALRQYREKTGINARLAVVGLTSTGFSIGDPKDPGTLNIAGFDSAVPQFLRDFSARDV